MLSLPIDTVVIDLAHDLAAIAGSADYDDQAAALLATLLPSDDLIWAHVDLTTVSATVRGAGAKENAARASALANYGHTHEGLRSYERTPNDVAPRRISDVTTTAAWHATALYNELYRQFGPAHQLGLLTSMAGHGMGSGWTFTRTGSDFTDDEVALAGRMLPVLIALDAVRAPEPAQPCARLKPREVVLLTHLATGLTARSIGYQMGISERTVRKHLGELYAVLHCNDRLVAVQRARDVGVLR